MRAWMMLTLVVAVAVVTAACGDSKSSFLPTAPSALSSETSPVDAGITAGTMGSGPQPGNGNGNGHSPAPATTETTKVEFEGPIDAVGDASITVSMQEIGITDATVIRHGDRSIPRSALRPGDRVHVRANRTGPVVEATEIKLQNPCNDCVVEPPPPDPDQVVSVTAFDAEAVEGSTDTGTFRLSRTGTAAQLEATLAVSFTLGGTATADDYAPIALTQVFPAGESTVDVVVTGQDDGATESAETVDLTLAAGAGYVAGSPASATVTIVDAPPQVSVRAADPIANEAENGGRFEITRTGDASLPLTVTLEFSGTALLGIDYIVTSHATSGSRITLTFGPGQNVAPLVFVMPLDDPHAEPEETIILTVVDGADYDRGATFSDTVFIAASDQPQ